MNCEERIKAISAKRESIARAESEKLVAEDLERDRLIAEVKSMRNRIQDVIAVGNSLKENNFLYLKSVLSEDRRLSKYGYDGGVVADGIHHHTGLMAGYEHRSEPTIKWVGIRMGGACGSYDFYTDGYVVKSVLDSGSRTHSNSSRWEQDVPIKHLKWFLEEFPVFEAALYAWIDNM